MRLYPATPRLLPDCSLAASRRADRPPDPAAGRWFAGRASANEFVLMRQRYTK